MNGATITDAKEARRFLQGRIQIAIERFQHETGLEVESIDLQRIQSSSPNPQTPIVTVRVELP